MEKDVTCHMTISGSGKDHEELFAAKQQELNPDDLVFEPWGAGFPMMDGSVTNQWGVRVTHKPTGETGESDHYKSQLRNKEEALAVLRHRLAVSRG